MTITAKNVGRINVWPTYDIARAADTEESEFVGQLTVWRTSDEARANISHEEGGGEPDWVPENAAIHIDLVRAFAAQDAAWVRDVGVVEVESLLGADPNTGNGWSTTSYSAADLMEYGLFYAVNPPALIGAALSMLLSGATVRMKVTRFSGDGISNLVVTSANGNDAIRFKMAHNEASTVSSYGGPLNVATDGVVTNSGEDGMVNILAATLASARAEFSINGVEAEAGVVQETDRPTGNPMVAAIVDPLGPLSEFTLYDALPDTTGLSELSEDA